MAVGQSKAQGLIDRAQARVAEFALDSARIRAQVPEALHNLAQRARGDLPDAGAVEGDDAVDPVEVAVVATQEVEGGGEVATEAVAGDAEVRSRRQLAVTLQGVVPVFEVGDLPESPAVVLEFELVRAVGIAYGVVEKFGAAQTEDVFPGLDSLHQIVLQGPEEGAAEAGAGVREVVDHGPLLGKLGRLRRGEFAGAVVAGGESFYRY